MSYGEVAFNAYRRERLGLAFDGTPVPTWQEVPEPIRAAWEVAAQAVLIERFRVSQDLPKVPGLPE